jgi:hypothetical protein
LSLFQPVAERAQSKLRPGFYGLFLCLSWRNGNADRSLAILSEEGIKAQYHYVGSLSADVFIFYLKGFVLPILTEGKTIIIDNHPVHRAKSRSEILNKKYD